MEAESSAKMGHKRRLFNLMFVNCVRETSAVCSFIHVPEVDIFSHQLEANLPQYATETVRCFKTFKI